MAQTYARDPNSLNVLKKFIDPLGQSVSPNVIENDPELALPIATTNLEQESNDKLRRLLGLGPSPALEEQRAELVNRDRAINAARTAADPEVSAEADKQFRERMQLAGEPNRVQGANALALEKQKQEPLQRFLDQQGTADENGPTPNRIEYRPTVTENGISFTGVPEPAMVRQQQHSAEVGLGGISALRQIVDTLNNHGLIGPAAGRFGEAATSTGLDKYLMSPEAAQAFSDFKAQSSLVKSNLAMTHGGARGGSSPGLIARFDALINPHQSAAALKGGLDAFERWLTAYARSKNSADLDAADQALGVGAQPADAYANPDYQPK